MNDVDIRGVITPINRQNSLTFTQTNTQKDLMKRYKRRYKLDKMRHSLSCMGY